MTDRSLRADARRGLPVTGETPHGGGGLRDRIAAAIVADLKRAVPPVAAYPGGPNLNGGMPRTEFDMADAALAAVQPELDRLEQHIEELQDKLVARPDQGGCGCSFDGPGMVCVLHSPTVHRLAAELAEAQRPVRAIETDALHGWYAAMDDAAVPAPAAEADAPTCGVPHPRKVSTCTLGENHRRDHHDAFGHTWPKRDGDKPLFPKETT